MANYYLARATRPKRFSEHVAEAGERYEARLKSDADVQSLQDDQRLRTILQESGGDLDAAATAAAAAGIDPKKVSDLEQRAFGRVERKQKLSDWKNQATDREQKRALDRMKVGVAIADQLESVTDQDTYSPWLAGARDLARQYDVPFTAPDNFDESWVAKKREQGRAARRQVELIAGDDAEALGLPQGALLWQDKRTGKPERLHVPTAPAAERPMLIGDPNSPSGSRYVSPRDAVGQPGVPRGKSGMRVVGYDGAGRPLIEIGDDLGDSSVTTATRNAIEKDMLAQGDTLGALAAIKSRFKPNYQTLGTRLGVSWNRMKDRLNPESVTAQERAELEDFTSYRAEASQLFSDTLKALSGAAVTEPELKRATAWLPNPGTGFFDGDSPAELQAKVTRFEQFTRRAMAKDAYIRRHGLSKEDVDLDQMPRLMQRRGDDLAAEARAQGVPDEEIVRVVKLRLADEFGIGAY